MRKSNGHWEEAADSNYLKLDLVSVAFLIMMPSKEEENEDGVLPELAFAMQDVPVEWRGFSWIVQTGAEAGTTVEEFGFESRSHHSDLLEVEGLGRPMGA
ncbi:hypothetical protein FRC04_001542 [Tulasnella sp. 424]|nr:hypothetical protein FRC04_001542 [Tulasnella sp. 424]